ncbi:16S rRNA (guanine(527)-N(7))-methyltransferase RsmG [Yoonia sp.]|uniref:16S rRNA (guanine(527)-N(7))-methyltransferase RsmG n=1 Tax=Yoonia sp. TaxID=2212373 RepID=UPI001A0A3774|nr:16S rRNA (guanine(527)-N(7))-methyltransferase RsmG [Yoonia sp.]MBE0413861.1 16S rRNA (guanine(527)-N(7))-methyltransferase RsmG [Yoonia sp.]
MSGKIGGQNVSRETIADLQAFAALVEKWTPRINLISRASVPELWNRHIIDSMQLYLLAPADYQTWVDLGSGGGFPGIVMAIIGKAEQPNAHFTLIESDQRKSSFLRTASRELSLPVTVIADRIEEVVPQNADIVSARALTSVSGLLPLIHRHLQPDGVALLHKGQRYEAELAEARQSWQFDLEASPSLTDSAARLLTLKRIHRDPSISS